MALMKQGVPLNFVKGLDTKSDPKQVSIGSFLGLFNSVFTTTGRLTKRNGNDELPSPTGSDVTALTTYASGLVALNDGFNTFSADTELWSDKGPIQQLDLSVTPVVRSNSSQLTVDSAIASNNLTCTVWYDADTHSYYRITDGETGNVIVNTTLLPATASATNGPKVVALNNYFVIFYLKTVTANTVVQYVAIPINNPSAPVNPNGTTTGVISGETLANTSFDCCVSNNSAYLAVCTDIGGGNTDVTLVALSGTLVLSAAVLAGYVLDPLTVSICADATTNNLFVTAGENSNPISLTVFNTSLIRLLAPTTLTTGYAFGTTTITSAVYSGLLTVFYSLSGAYSYTPNSPHTAASRTDATHVVTYNFNTAAVGAASIIARGVGIMSKAFYMPATAKFYCLLTYGGLMQPTYFLSDSSGNIIAKLAYANGFGFLASGQAAVSSVSVVGEVASIGYLFKDLTTPVNKNTPVSGSRASGVQVAGIYAQTGINVAHFDFGFTATQTLELANSLEFSGGFMWQYDGVLPVEQGFHLYPEDIGTSTTTGAGSIAAGTYFYVVTYEWTDAQGIIHRSAPSVPVTQVTTTASSTNTIKVPTLRQTYKLSPNPVRIVLYRWSVAQQVYYQVTSVTSPTTNDTTANSVTITDTSADSTILGNTVLYTTGGVVEDIAAPAISAITAFKSRLFAIDAEDRNLLWYSKQVIEQTPVEMSDLFTLYVTPTISVQATTGPMQALSAMDDKLIIFKANAIYYITGTGPDNTGANNDFSDPVFITASVGSSNPRSLVFIPNGIMFESNKGIWLLGRDLSTSYIGAAVEGFNGDTVVSAKSIPNTTQVRFKLASGATLMYDYYFDVWGAFKNVGAVTSTIYQGLETFIDSYGRLLQESPGSYLDVTEPVLLGFQTGWISLAGLQGYERLYEILFLGQYHTPFKLAISISYDFNSSPQSFQTIVPDNYNPAYGSYTGAYGAESPYGGNEAPFKARVFPTKQKCESFQITAQEVYDPSFGVQAGEGLSLSGIDLVVGIKKSYRPTKAAQSFG